MGGLPAHGSSRQLARVLHYRNPVGSRSSAPGPPCAAKSLLALRLFVTIPPMPRSRSLMLGIATILVFALLGGVLGHGVAAREDRLPEQYQTFAAALDAIEARYVDKVESDQLVYGAIGEDAKGWTSDQAVRKLRGEKGTTVQVSIRRTGVEDLIPIEVARDEISIPTVPAYFMADEQTGYVQLRDFAENTDRDLSKALTDLSNQGMRRLLLDLRNNPGGPLDQAIRVSNRFLPKGDLIVYTKGRMPNSDMSYRATEESEYTRLPVVVLTNRNSASASEIVSGALQDHDRALIVGETTFGKALVQSVMRLREGAGLALTTARYYTPSGRLIQRPWDGTFDEYLTYSLRGQSSERTHDATDLKLTDSGRKVYSGGGIEPDRHLEGPIEGFNPTKFGRSLYARQ